MIKEKQYTSFYRYGHLKAHAQARDRHARWLAVVKKGFKGKIKSVAIEECIDYIKNNPMKT